ncbi:MAG: peptide deformylase [Rhodospirillales bacterium]|jgi:peptide deformylase|nr:peptide deformylase [Rhodospirillales bacterium]
MSILKIARMGHPVLRAIAQPVADPRAPELRRLVEDMVETLADAGGVGLAAPQVHASLRLVIFFVPAIRGGEEVPLTVLINPVFEPLGEDMEEGSEGCLSLPGLAGLVPRYSAIRYSGYGLDGQPIRRQAQGYHARVVQHECDHLDGILYPARIEDFSHFGYAEELQKEQE